MARQPDILNGTTTYLSGPMDFVVDRAAEQRSGWRARISEVLAAWGVRVFDPWDKPLVRNLGRYGLEDETSNQTRAAWQFQDGAAAAQVRSSISGDFWPVMHIDLRMVDLSDYVIACCPTNLYSVGTPHEIVLARQQRKPVLLVSPPVRYPRWQALRTRFAKDAETTEQLDAIQREVAILENPAGTPSSWYATLVGSEAFFDGFGWASYRARFGWAESDLDAREGPGNEPKRPLLPYLESINDGNTPRGWDARAGQFRDNDDWLLLERRAAERQSASDPAGGEEPSRPAS